MALVFRRSSQVTGEGGSSAAGIAAAASAAEAAADAGATAADRVQTGLDRVATAADRVQTGLDRAAASSSASAAASSASASSTSASASSASAVAAAASAVAAAASAASAAVQAPYLSPFGGRLTLESGNPTPSTDQVSKQNLYYAPLSGKSVPVRISGSYVQKDFIASATDQVGLTLALGGSPNWAANTIHDVFAIWNSSALKLATRVWDAGMYPTETQITNVTAITTGTGANAWTSASHAFDGNASEDSTTCARNTSNTGLANFLGQDWGSGNAKTVTKVVITAATDNGIRGDEPSALVCRVDGSADGTNWVILQIVVLNCTVGATHTIPINFENRVPYRYHRFGITGDGSSGCRVAELQFYEETAPSAGRRLTKYDGIWVNDAALSGNARIDASTLVSVSQYEATFLGVVLVDAVDGQLTCHTEYGPSRRWAVWNAYNRRKIELRAGLRSTTYSYNLSSRIWTPCEASSTFGLTYVCGLAEEQVHAELARPVFQDAQVGNTSYCGSIGVDSITTPSGSEFSTNFDSTGQAVGTQGTAKLNLRPFAGKRTLTGLERLSSSIAGTVSLFTDARNTGLEASLMG